MGLGLDVVRTRGRASVPLPTVISVRPLSADEVLRASAREAGTKPPPLRQVMERHRQLARLLAAGKSPGAAAAEMGYSASRVSILLDDPTFQELLARYRQSKDDHLYGMGERLAAVGATSLDILIDRMEADPDEFSPDELITIAKLGADRTGFGPSKTETKNVNVNFGDLLEQARQRAAAALSPPEVIDIEYEEVR